MKKALYWTPRVLGILYAAFISIFALDVFGEYRGWELAVALFMHLVPTYVVVAALLVAWKWERIGGVIFVLLGVFYIWAFWGKADLIAYAIISGPVFLIGGLFLVGGNDKSSPPA